MADNEDRMREVIFAYLSSIADLSTVKTKDVRNHVLSTMGLPKDYFGGDSKEVLLKIISNYEIPLIAPEGVITRVVETPPTKNEMVKKPIAKATTKTKASPNPTPQKTLMEDIDFGSDDDDHSVLTKRAMPLPIPIKKPSAKSDPSSADDAPPKKKPTPVAKPTPLTFTPVAVPTSAKKVAVSKSSASKNSSASKGSARKSKSGTSDSEPDIDEANRENENKFRGGKYSKRESDAIYDAAVRYTEERGLQLTDLCTQYKSGEANDQNRHLPFWRELKELLPDRTKHVRDLLALVIIVFY